MVSSSNSSADRRSSREELLGKLRDLVDETRRRDPSAEGGSSEAALREVFGEGTLDLQARAAGTDWQSDTLLDALLDSLEQTSAHDGGAVSAHALSLQAGRNVGGYEILREIGRGGQGTVYLAFDPVHERFVALKVLPSAVSSRALERFRREAALTARVADSGICRVYDVGVDEGLSFLAMEYVEGTTVEELVARVRGRGPIQLVSDADGGADPQTVVRLFARVARSLHLAHEAGLVHRDIKPGNLIVADDGDLPVLLDFGLARDEDVESSLTRTGDTVGTPAYMSPEQLGGLRGDGRQPVDRRSDIWSLGATFYECLVGLRPFVEPTRERLYGAILRDSPVPLRRAMAAAPPKGLDLVVEACLRKEPEHRYATALDFADDLERILVGDSVRIRRMSAPERLWRWSRRNPGVASLTLGLFVVLAIGFGVSFQLWREAEDQRGSAVEALADREVALREAHIARARSLRSGFGPGRRFEALQALSAAARIQDGVDVWSGAAAALCVVDATSLEDFGLPETARRSTFDASFDRVFWADEAGVVSTAVVGSNAVDSNGESRVDLGMTRVLYTARTGPRRLVASPRGDYLAVDAGGAVDVVGVDGAVVFSDVPTGGIAYDFADVDGRLLFGSVDDEGLLRVWQVSPAPAATAEPVLRRMVSSYPYALAFDRAGGRLAISSYRRQRVEIIDLSAPEDTRAVRLDVGARALDWCPIRADELVVACGDGSLRFLDAGPTSDEFDEQRRISAHSDAVATVRYSPNGRFVLSASRDRSLRIWSAASGARVFESESGTGSFDLSDDGSRLAWNAGPVASRVWRMCLAPRFWESGRPDGDELVRLRQPAFGPRGESLWCVAPSSIRNFDADSGFESSTWISCESEGRTGMAFDPRTEDLLVVENGALVQWGAQRSTQDRLVLGPPVVRRRWTGGGDGPSPVRVCSVEGETRLVTRASTNRAVAATIDSAAAPKSAYLLHPRLSGIAISRSGRHIATASRYGDNVCLWNGEDGTLVERLDATGGAIAADDLQVAFSPDERWLVGFGPSDAMTPCYLVWEILADGGVELAERIPCDGASYGPLAFDETSGLLAICPGLSEIRILQLGDDGRTTTVLDLERTSLEAVHDLTFCRVTGRLAATGTSVAVWELADLLEDLRDLGLPALAAGKAVPVVSARRSRVPQAPLILSDGGSLPETMNALDELIVEDPEDIGSRLLRARLLMQSARPSEAMEVVQKILQAQPAHLPSRAVRARISRELGRFESALADHEWLLAQPLGRIARIEQLVGAAGARLLATANLEEGSGPAVEAGSVAALRRARQALRMDPASGQQAWLALATAATRLRLVDEARGAFSVLSKVDATTAASAHLVYPRAEFAWLTGDVRIARQLLGQADAWRAKHAPDDPEVAALARRADRLRGDLDTRSRPRARREVLVPSVVRVIRQGEGTSSRLGLGERRTLGWKTEGAFEVVEGYQRDGILKLTLLQPHTGAVQVHGVETWSGSLIEPLCASATWQRVWSDLLFYAVGDADIRIVLQQSKGGLSTVRLGSNGARRRTLNTRRWTIGWDRVALVDGTFGPIFAHMKSGTGDLHTMRLGSQGLFGGLVDDLELGKGWTSMASIPLHAAVEVDASVDQRVVGEALLLHRASDGATQVAPFDVTGRLGDFAPGRPLPGDRVRIVRSPETARMAEAALAVCASDEGHVEVIDYATGRSLGRLDSAAHVISFVVGEELRLLLLEHRIE